MKNDLDPTGNAYFKFEFSRAAIMSNCTKADGGNNAVDIYPIITPEYDGSPWTVHSSGK